MMHGEPAFPFQTDSLSYGMTLRDYFAAKAMQGFLANPQWNALDPERIAEWSYDQADAMMEARKNET